MGTLTCSRCRATTEADSIEEGRKNLNHAIGLGIGKPCYDGLAKLIFTGKAKSKPKNVGNNKQKSKTDSIPKDTKSKDEKSKDTKSEDKISKD